MGEVVPDSELIAAARAGDSGAAGEFFVRNLSYLQAMSRRLVSSAEQAQYRRW